MAIDQVVFVEEPGNRYPTDQYLRAGSFQQLLEDVQKGLVLRSALESQTSKKSARIGLHKMFVAADISAIDAYQTLFDLKIVVPTTSERRQAAETILTTHSFDKLFEFCDRFGYEGVVSETGRGPKGLGEALAKLWLEKNDDRFQYVLDRLQLTDELIGGQEGGRGIGVRVMEELGKQGAWEEVKRLVDRFHFSEQARSIGIANGFVDYLGTFHPINPSDISEVKQGVVEIRTRWKPLLEKLIGLFPDVDFRFTNNPGFTEDQLFLQSIYTRFRGDRLEQGELWIFDAFAEGSQSEFWKEKKEEVICHRLSQAGREDFFRIAELLSVSPKDILIVHIRVLAFFLKGRLREHQVKKIEKFLKTHQLDHQIFSESHLKKMIRERLTECVNSFSIDQARLLEQTTQTQMLTEIISLAKREKAYCLDDLIKLIQRGDEQVEELIELYEIQPDDFQQMLPPSVLMRELPVALHSLLETDPWTPSLKRLVKIQGRSSRFEHDPWVTDLDPLVEKLTSSLMIDRNSKEHGLFLYEFVKLFGMVNTPLLAELFIELKQGRIFLQLTHPQQQRLIETIGTRVARMSNDQLVNELKLTKQRLVNDLLADKMPSRLSTELGIEMLNATVGVTRWKREEDRPDALVEKLRKTMLVSSYDLIPPDAYFDSRDPQRAGMQLTVRRAHKRRAPREDRKRIQTDIDRILTQDSSSGEKGFFQRLERAAELAWNEEGEEGILEKIHALNNIRREDIEHLTNAEERGVWLQEQMEVLVENETVLSKDDWLAISLRHLLSIKGNDWAQDLVHVVRQKRGLAQERLEQITDALRFYLFEHYLADDQVGHDVGHLPFSRKLTSVLQNAWELDRSQQENHPAFVMMEKINRLSSQLETIVYDDETRIDLVATGGVLRLFSGDVGDACYNSKHEQLAKGEYPGVRSLMFVTHRGDGKERLVGSVLFIEAETKDGKRVLVIRANNPRQNLLSVVSVDDLVEQTIQAAIRVAKRGGFDFVVLPMDEAGQSSSNRKEVSVLYKKHFRTNQRIALKRSPETAFNGYDLTDPKGQHGVVVVWEKK